METKEEAERLRKRIKFKKIYIYTRMYNIKEKQTRKVGIKAGKGMKYWRKRR